MISSAGIRLAEALVLLVCTAMGVLVVVAVVVSSRFEKRQHMLERRTKCRCGCQNVGAA